MRGWLEELRYPAHALTSQFVPIGKDGDFHAVQKLNMENEGSGVYLLFIRINHN
jgi:hypothetical protein